MRFAKYLLCSLMVLLLTVQCKESKDEPVALPIESASPEFTRSSFKPKPRNVALILDTSGSMIRTDPNRLTLYSAMLFTDLLEADDHLTVLSFPGRDLIATQSQLEQRIRSWVDGPHNIISGRSKHDTKQWIRGLQYNSNFTVFTEPMQRALAAVGQGDDEHFSKRGIVFFSDGETDRRNIPRTNREAQLLLAADHAAEKETLRTQILPRLREKRIGFYGVVLGKDTLSDLFDMMAAQTDGLVRRALAPQDLATNFTQVFSNILQTEVEQMVLHANRPATQEINNYVKELIIIVPTASLGAAEKIHLHLVEPAANKLDKPQALYTGSSQKSSEDLYRRTLHVVDGLTIQRDGRPFEAGGYAIWKIARPAPGNWTIQLDGQTVSSTQAIVIQNYGIYLEVEGSKNRMGMVGDPNTFKARLVTEDGDPIVDPAFYARNNFRFEFYVDRDKVTERRPDSQFQMQYDYIPATAASSVIEIVARNDRYLNVRVPIDFEALKDVVLNLKGPIEFGNRVPWTDWFLEGIGNLLGERRWEKGTKWNAAPAEADFSVSMRQAEGVRFKIDNTELYKTMKAKVLSADGKEIFYLDPNMRVKFCIDIDRDSHGGDLSSINVPITTVSGKPISGVTALPLQGHIAPLSPWSWKYSHLWLEPLIILWLLLFFIGKPVVYLTGNSFPKSKRYIYYTRTMFDNIPKDRPLIKEARASMGRSVIWRLPMSFFQFSWGIQVAAGGKRLRTNPFSRLLFWILAIFLPLSMADSKKIGRFTFYRYKGKVLVSEPDYRDLQAAQDMGEGDADYEETRPDPCKLLQKKTVNKALVDNRNRVLHIPE